TLARLLAADDEAEHRQVGLVDAQGNAAAHTGEECFEYAGHFVGEGFACQGNILVGRHVIEAMAEAYQRTGGDLADRLMAALYAADRSGGDKRGRQSAGILVVKAGGGYGGDNDRMLDLRVDDHEDPVVRLREL
ncbi:MAG: fimbrial assembly protein FimA, partial [Candidatus Thermofonsia Clade 1 bacterium]